MRMSTLTGDLLERFLFGDTAVEKTSGGQEFGIEQGGAGGAPDEVVREQGEFYIEQGTFADAADYGGHAVAGVGVAAGLGAIFFVEDEDRIFQRGG